MSVALATSLRDVCSCSCVSLQCKSAGPGSSEPQSQEPLQAPKLGGLFCAGAGGGLASAFHAADGGRRQLLPVALPINLGTAVLKALLLSSDLRPPTAQLWLPGSWQVPFKPS